MPFMSALIMIGEGTIGFLLRSRYFTNSSTPPLYIISSRFSTAWRMSDSTILTPELRNASSRRRCSSVAKSYSTLVKVPVEAVNVNRNAAAVVAHGDRAVGVEHDLHRGGVAGQRLVDGVVDDLVDHVMQAGTVVGVADIHARPLAHGVEAFQNPDRFRPVLDRNGMLSVGDRSPGRFCHVRPSRMSRISGAKSGADRLICAMKGAMRLAQSLYLQVIE